MHENISSKNVLLRVSRHTQSLTSVCHVRAISVVQGLGVSDNARQGNVVLSRPPVQAGHTACPSLVHPETSPESETKW